jgi:tetratricopeptide (TPR) repeat protein
MIAPALASPRAMQLDDLPGPLAAQDRGEAAQDRVAALAHFAAGRTLQQRGDFVEACRRFARADRLDPASRAARSVLVACAVEAKRYAVAARYAAKGIDPEEAGEEALDVLADYWVKDGNLPAAIQSSEQLLACIATRRDRAAELGDDESVLRAQLAELNVRYALRELYGLAGKRARAADQAARVVEVLDHPERLHLKANAASSLLDVELRTAYKVLGEAFLMADRFDAAEAAFRKANTLSPDAVVLDLNLARIAARRGRAAEALAKLQPYLDRHMSTEGEVPYQLLADALKKLGHENELLDRLGKLRAADRANVALGFFLAGEYVKAGKLDLAEQIYTELAAHGPILLTCQPLAEIYRKQHRPDKLLALLGKVMAASGSLEALGAEAKLLTTNAALYDSLVEAGREKSKGRLATADYAEFLSLGMLAQERKQYDVASEFFELALTADATKASEVLLAWGIGSLIDERPAEAAKIFQRGIDAEVMPGGNPVFHFYLSGALAAVADGDSGNLDAALSAARTAAKLNPGSARFAARVAWLLFRSRHYNEARQAYERLLEKFTARSTGRATQRSDGRQNPDAKSPESPAPNAVEPDSPETIMALREARLELSAVCVALGRIDEAEERLEEVLDDYPDDVEAHNDLGYLWADENKHLSRALKMISLAVAAEPDNRAFRDSLGWVYYRLGRYGEAAAELEKAIDKKQPDGTVLDHLGEAYRKLGKTEKARDVWRRAIAAYDKDKEPEKARKVAAKLAEGK